MGATGADFVHETDLHGCRKRGPSADIRYIPHFSFGAVAWLVNLCILRGVFDEAKSPQQAIQQT